MSVYMLILILLLTYMCIHICTKGCVFHPSFMYQYVKHVQADIYHMHAHIRGQAPADVYLTSCTY